MIRLRPFKPSDSKIICGWINGEEDFYQWCAGMYGYPLTARQLTDRFLSFQSDENAWFMTALDENGIVCGHFIFRKADFKQNSVHIGFVILAPEYRGKGIGRQMMRCALKYASDILGMNTVTLGVFLNNTAAVDCYRSVGFRFDRSECDAFEFKGHKWDCIHMKYTADEKRHMEV